MMQRRWYYRNGTCFETFNILFDNSRFMLVQNDSTKNFSFGTSDSFNTLYGFGVNQSCLTKSEAIAELQRWISIDKKYPDLREIERQYLGYTSIDQWESMISALENLDDSGENEQKN